MKPNWLYLISAQQSLKYWNCDHYNQIQEPIIPLLYLEILMVLVWLNSEDWKTINQWIILHRQMILLQLFQLSQLDIHSEQAMFPSSLFHF